MFVFFFQLSDIPLSYRGGTVRMAPSFAHSPMLSNPFGKVTEVSPLHSLNAATPILVDPSGEVTGYLTS